MPLYVRALRLRQLGLTGTQCFLLFEGIVVVGALLALAELVPWWGVFALPGAVAAMVKINDLIAGTATWGTRRGTGTRGTGTRGTGTRRATGTRATGGASARGAASTRGTLRAGSTASARRAAGAAGAVNSVASGGAGPAMRTGAGINGYATARGAGLRGAGRPGGMAAHDRQAGGTVTGRVIGRASVPAALRAVPPDENTTLGLAHATNVAPVAEPVDSPRQRARQSATRRYE
jgi:hypothetical protein